MASYAIVVAAIALLENAGNIKLPEVAVLQGVHHKSNVLVS